MIWWVILLVCVIVTIIGYLWMKTRCMYDHIDWSTKLIEDRTIHGSDQTISHHDENDDKIPIIYIQPKITHKRDKRHSSFWKHSSNLKTHTTTTQLVNLSSCPVFDVDLSSTDDANFSHPQERINHRLSFISKSSLSRGNIHRLSQVLQTEPKRVSILQARKSVNYTDTNSTETNALNLVVATGDSTDYAESNQSPYPEITKSKSQDETIFNTSTQQYVEIQSANSLWHLHHTLDDPSSPCTVARTLHPFVSTTHWKMVKCYTDDNGDGEIAGTGCYYYFRLALKPTWILQQNINSSSQMEIYTMPSSIDTQSASTTTIPRPCVWYMEGLQPNNEDESKTAIVKFKNLETGKYLQLQEQENNSCVKLKYSSISTVIRKHTEEGDHHHHEDIQVWTSSWHAITFLLQNIKNNNNSNNNNTNKKNQDYNDNDDSDYDSDDDDLNFEHNTVLPRDTLGQIVCWIVQKSQQEWGWTAWLTLKNDDLQQLLQHIAIRVELMHYCLTRKYILIHPSVYNKSTINSTTTTTTSNSTAPNGSTITNSTTMTLLESIDLTQKIEVPIKRPIRSYISNLYNNHTYNILNHNIRYLYNYNGEPCVSTNVDWNIQTKWLLRYADHHRKDSTCSSSSSSSSLSLSTTSMDVLTLQSTSQRNIMTAPFQLLHSDYPSYALSINVINNQLSMVPLSTTSKPIVESNNVSNQHTWWTATIEPNQCRVMLQHYLTKQIVGINIWGQLFLVPPFDLSSGLSESSTSNGEIDLPCHYESEDVWLEFLPRTTTYHAYSSAQGESAANQTTTINRSMSVDTFLKVSDLRQYHVKDDFLRDYENDHSLSRKQWAAEKLCIDTICYAFIYLNWTNGKDDIQSKIAQHFQSNATLLSNSRSCYVTDSAYRLALWFIRTGIRPAQMSTRN